MNKEGGREDKARKSIQRVFSRGIGRSGILYPWRAVSKLHVEVLDVAEERGKNIDMHVYLIIVIYES